MAMIRATRPYSELPGPHDGCSFALTFAQGDCPTTPVELLVYLFAHLELIVYLSPQAATSLIGSLKPLKRLCLFRAPLEALNEATWLTHS